MTSHADLLPVHERTESSFVLFAGTLPYEELIPHLFPWANVAIDEWVYEEHDRVRWDEEAIWDEGEPVHLETFEDWSEDLPSGLRPFTQNDETAEWQFELSLSDLGRAYLLIDDFTSTPDPLL